MEGGLSRSVSCEESPEWQCPQGAVELHSKPHPPETRLQGVFTSQGDILLVKTKNENKQKTQTNKKTVYTQE